ncbi:hypothetical protein ACUOFC_33590, partial [Escherichia sp. TWPC-MK]
MLKFSKSGSAFNSCKIGHFTTNNHKFQGGDWYLQPDEFSCLASPFVLISTGGFYRVWMDFT